MDKALKANDEFNASVKFLARVYAAKKKGTFEEEKALRTNKRLAFLITTYPVVVIETCGPFFLKYASVIKKKSFEDLMELDFDEEKKTYKETMDGVNHTYEAMDGKIKFIKNLFRTASDEEKAEIVEHLEILLSAYCKYALAVKGMDKAT